MRGVKESSDSLDAPPPTTTVRASAVRRLSLRDYVALGVATCGVGYMPVAPGTWGSAVGVGIYLLLGALNTRVFNYVASRGWSVPPFEAFRTTFLLMMLFVIIIVGIWAATRVEPLLGRKDPGAVVIDEVAGQLITFLFVPFNSGMWATVAGFVAFRLFDIWKPYPIRRLEALESGLGVMADDVLAGAYAAMLMSLLTSIYLLL
ncbi:MAG TPA: phosphatidylglycerophosphatase A [Pyrinomonadaceae bacterium]|jgi:phosphatidylglycerophosphatase A